MGASQSGPELQTVEKVEVNRYVGKWYQIARKPFYWQNKDATDTTAEYSMDGNTGNIKVLNQEYVDGALKKAEGNAFATAPNSAKLRVSFFPFIYSDYWVIMLGNNYEYSVVSNRNGKYLWLLSRTPILDNTEAIVGKIKDLGIDTSDLIYTKHTKTDSTTNTK